MRLRNSILLNIAAATVIVTVLYTVWHPGAMSYDTFAMLSQARTGAYVDAWPPTFAALWSVLDRLVPGPSLILALQLSLYFCGAALTIGVLSRRCPVLALVAFIVFAIWPALHGIIGVIWIDNVMAAMFMLAIATATIAFGESKAIRAILLVVSSTALFLAVGLRHNAAAAGGPIAMLIIYAAISPAALCVRSLAIVTGGGVALIAICFALAAQLSGNLAQTKVNFWTGLPQYDLAGIAVRTSGEYFDEAVFAPQTFEDVRTLYSARSFIPLHAGYQVHQEEQGLEAAHATPLTRRFQEGSNSDRRELISAILSAITSHPGAYLAHRMDVFRSLIGAPPWINLWGAVYTRIDPNDLGILHRPELSSAFFEKLRHLSKEPIYRPYSYLAVSLISFPILIAFSIWTRDHRLAIASLICLSGLLHMLGLFFVVLSSDFRYSHWMITTTVLSIVIASSVGAQMIMSRCNHALDVR
jgi:hypothetical protein